MDQEKIGKFIVKQRKIQKLTQEQLAEKLNVSKNAVSKWERGLNLPDVSIMKELCCVLDITLNELFAGEKIEREEYIKKTDESLVTAIKYTNDKAKRKINKVMIFGVTLTLIFVILFSMIIIDFGRMFKNQPVLFSTWGFDYVPPINLNDEMLEIAIRNYIASKGDAENKQYENQKTFVSMKIYLIEEKDNFSKFNVYAWVLEQSYYLENDKIIESSGSSIPYKFVVNKINGEYVVINTRIPRDGSYYVKDMKTLFPFNVRKEMDKVHYDGTISKLNLDIEEQAKLYFHK